MPEAENTKQYDWVECINLPSISIKSYIGSEDFDVIWESPYNGLSSWIDKETVRG